MLNRRLCTICVRGGSKGVKGKNVRMLAGKPLLAHSLEQALTSGFFAFVGVSSDSDEILEVAAGYGATHLVRRPAYLATDESGKLPAIRHAVTSIEEAAGFRFDVVVDLDATSPLRSLGDIRGAIELLESGAAGIVITGCPARRSPYFNLVEQAPDGSVGLAKVPPFGVVRRQDSPSCFDMNASIYAWRRQRLFEAESLFQPDTRLFVMPEERSVDIDSEYDFELVEWLIKRRQGKGDVS